MTTSGNYGFNLTRDKIIRAAARKVGAITAGETPGSQLTQDFADQLNSMIKMWMSSGIHIWTETEAIMYTQLGQAAYPLGTGSPTAATTINATTTLTTGFLQGTTVIQVASNFQVSNGVTIGVTLDDGTVFYTTVASFSNLTITLAAPTPDSSTFGNFVYVVSSPITRPLRIPAARRWNTLSGIETPMTPLSRIDYFNLPEKNLMGTITQFFYDPRGGANTTGILYLWPTPSGVSNNNVKFTWLRPIQDFTSAADTGDFPQEWINTCVWNLAYNMAPEFGVPSEVYLMLKDQAKETLELAQGFDREPESTYFGVDFTRMGA